jgi:hypothetical protein
MVETIDDHHERAANAHASTNDGGGGNRTRVRGRTGQNLYKRSPRFNFDRRPEADTLPAA